MANEEETFGAGIALNNQWDLIVDETGDLSSVDGIEELEKDLAFNTAILLSEEIGERNTRDARVEMRSIVREYLIDDNRVDRIIDISLRETGSDEVEIGVQVLSNNEQQELVFEV